MERTLDMTKGNPSKLLLTYAIPLILTGALQQLYNVTDSAVVGQLLGTEPFASVGAAGWIYWLGLSVLIGLAQGFSVLLAQCFGAGDSVGLRNALFASACLMALLTTVLSLLGIFFPRQLLVLLNTPENIIDGAVVYLRLVSAGLMITAGYNLMATMLRAMGDVRTPLLAVVFASVANTGLDILFVWAFGWGIAGVAVATLISQGVACFYCTLALWRSELLRFDKGSLRLDVQLLRRLFGLGGPLAARNALVAVGSLFIQYIINGYGFLFVAGMTAARKITEFLEQFGEGIDSAISSYVAQNIGAKKMDRVRRGVRISSYMALGFAVALGLLTVLGGRWALGLFLTDGQMVESAVSFGETYLTIFGIALPLLFIVQNYRGALKGMGDTVTPMLSSFAELAIRVLIVVALPLAMGVSGVYYAEPVGWFLTGLVIVVTYFIRVSGLKIR